MSTQHNVHKQKARSYKVIGTPRPKVDAYGKVTGRALYADDIMLPRMLYGRLLRSPHIRRQRFSQCWVLPWSFLPLLQGTPCPLPQSVTGCPLLAFRWC